MAARRRSASSGRDELSQLLLAVRGELSQSQAAHRAGMTQSKISRAESGRFPLSPAEAETYAAALDAPLPQRRRLAQLAAAHEATNITGRRQLIASAHVIQRRIADLLDSTATLRAWVPDLIPGILQTEEYTRAVLGHEPEARWWAPRRDQRRVLDDPTRDVHLIVGEAALRWGLGSVEVMTDQLRHLAAAAGRPPLRLGVVPLGVIHPAAPPRGFYVYGDHTASQATEIGTAFIGEPDVGAFVADHAALERVALYDAAARELMAAAGETFGHTG